MRCDQQIIVMNDHVVEWCSRKIQLQSLPVRAIVKRNKNAGLRSGVEHALTLGIFAYSVQVRAVRQSIGEQRPGLSEIGRLENIRFEIIQLMRIDSGVSRARVKR